MVKTDVRERFDRPASGSAPSAARNVRLFIVDLFDSRPGVGNKAFADVRVHPLPALFNLYPRGYTRSMIVATSIKNFLTTPEAAKELGITKSLVRRYIREGRLRAEVAGERTYLIPRKAVEDFKRIPRRPGPKVRRAG